MPAAARWRPTSCPEDGRALLRAWLDAVDLRLSERDLLALLQSDGFSHAALERRARRCHERGLERAVARAIAAPGELDAAAEDVFTRVRRRDPLRARRGLPRAREEQARAPRRRAAAGGAGRRRHRLDARRHAHAGRDPRARRARLRGRGDRHRPARGPPVVRGGRGRRPVLRRAEGGRAVAARGGRGAERRPLRRAARLRARAGGRRVRADRARARAADRGLLPHGADRLHGAAQRRREARIRHGGRA